MPASTITRLADLKDYLGFVLLAAPDDFPKMGAFTGDAQHNLRHAFSEMRGAMPLVAKKADAATMEVLEDILDRSLAAYSAGEHIKGAHLLQDFEDLAFPNRFKDYEAQ